MVAQEYAEVASDGEMGIEKVVRVREFAVQAWRMPPKTSLQLRDLFRRGRSAWLAAHVEVARAND